MSTENTDIDALNAIVVQVAELVSETIDNLSDDGKISKVEALGYIDNLIPSVEAAMGAGEALAEIKQGISAEERAKILASLKEHFDLKDDSKEEGIELIIEGVLGMVENGYTIAQGVKAIKAAE